MDSAIDSEKWKEIRQMEIVEMLAYFQGKIFISGTNGLKILLEVNE